MIFPCGERLYLYVMVSGMRRSLGEIVLFGIYCIVWFWSSLFSSSSCADMFWPVRVLGRCCPIYCCAAGLRTVCAHGLVTWVVVSGVWSKVLGNRCTAIVLLSLPCMYRTSVPLASSFFLGRDNGIVSSSPSVWRRDVFICFPFHIMYDGIFVAEWGIKLYLIEAPLTASSQYFGGSLA